MRMAELSRRSRVSIPTIKFYLQQGLLDRGRLTSPNQADYGESHLERLRLVRALVEVGGLSVAATHELIADLDTPGRHLDERLGRVVRAIDGAPGDPDDTPAPARERVARLVDEHGWSDTSADYPARRRLEQLVATLARLGADDVLASLDRYAGLASEIAAADLDLLARHDREDAVLEHAIVVTVLGDALLGCMRRVAQAAESGRRYPRGGQESTGRGSSHA